ncbi:MAG: VWA domain-containing protein [Planctomycetaceae bacterium]|nr:VWA domain-containing protein [Planctomycetaceae bacterium]
MTVAPQQHLPSSAVADGESHGHSRHLGGSAESAGGSVADRVQAEHAATGFHPLAVWCTSLLLHSLLVVLSSAIYFTVESQPELPELTVTVEDIDDAPLVLQEMTQELDSYSADHDAPVTETSKAVAATAANHKLREQILDPRLDTQAPTDPLAYGLSNNELSEVLEGVEGAVVATEGDVGTVDRITQEIVARLRTGRVAVAWLMDASESLSERREQVITRFDRVYRELDELAAGHKESLLTSVSAFGRNTVVVTKEPTADRKAIQDAVHRIPVDDSGVENVFAAIRETAEAHKLLSRKGYQVMMVVLTDECGNDFSELDDALRHVKRSRIPVFVMGPMAPFGCHEVKVPWTHPQTHEVYRLPVERGPESIRLEYTALPSWNNELRDLVLPSGLGAFGLARLSRESGGIYFLYPDKGVSRWGIDLTSMLRYSPEYVTTGEYTKLVEKSPLRQVVLGAADVMHKAGWRQPQTRFLASGIQFDIRDSQDTLVKLSEFFDNAITQMRAVEKERDEETSPRWLAHYDLLMGRLLANRIRLNNSIPLLNEMYARPKACQDGTTNAWELTGIEGTALRNPGGEGVNPDAAANSSGDDEQDLSIARSYLERVEARHPGTPWAVLARLELDAPMEFEWQEAFMTPPAGEKLPWDQKPWSELSEKQKEAKKKFERFQVLEKQKAEAAAEKSVTPDGKPVKIPKL